MDKQNMSCFFPNFKENTVFFPIPRAPGPSPKKGCESPEMACSTSKNLLNYVFSFLVRLPIPKTGNEVGLSPTPG